MNLRTAQLHRTPSSLLRSSYKGVQNVIFTEKYPKTGIQKFVFLYSICYNAIRLEGLDMDYRPQGVCSRQIHFDIIDNKVRNVSFVGGCNGNLQGISRLIEGMDVDEAISRIDGIRCGFKSTSCPDQLAQALKQAVGK